MRNVSRALVALGVAALVGCESPPPPQSLDRADGITLAPPAPAAPAEPAPPPPPANAPAPAQAAVAEGIAKARAAMAAKEAAEKAGAVPDAAAAEGAPADAAAPEAAPDAPPADAPADGAAPADQPPPEGEELKQAEVGVGVKGKDYGGPGFITTPIQTYFQAQDRIDFEVQIPKAMQLYKAAHNDKGPKTHEEYMQVIIKEHGVKLPELPAGETYWYDAKTEQLMVRAAKPAT
ncbi:MAG: hypothetical protein AB7O59_05980 [Pirellulales bacterium]